MHEWFIALLGGVIIGLSASVLLLFNGRIAGISGIVYGLPRTIMARAKTNDWSWRLLFLLGFIAAGVPALWFFEGSGRSPASTPVIIIAGLFVGFGTRMSNGCTSGHGVCGLGRLSKRSFAAVMIFMLMAIITVAVRRYIGGL
jgi:uncharacterized protein